MYTKVQKYAISILRKLLSVRHDQMHWLIGMEFPEEREYVQAQMRRLSYLGKAVNDGQYYYWPGCDFDADMIAALDFMRGASGAEQPFFCLQEPPCKLAFSIFRDNKQLSCGVFFPKPGEEWDTAVAIDEFAAGQSAAVFLKSRDDIPRFSIRRPHIFVCPNEDGGYDYIDGKAEGGN